MDLDNFLENILEKAVKEINQGCNGEESKEAPDVDKSLPCGPKYMSMTYHRQFWQNFPLFCPFGRSPAKSLLLNTPLSVPKARILLLACGDIRHLLFTAWSMRQGKGLSSKQKLDVVMCDHEPSILARNILFFRLLANGMTLPKLWCIYYAKLIDAECLVAIQGCATELLMLDGSLSTWHETEFGNAIRFCDIRSYALVREIWKVYAFGRACPENDARIIAEREKYLDIYCGRRSTPADASGVDGDEGVSIPGSTFGDPCFLEAMSNGSVHASMKQQYYRDGRAPSCIYNPAKKSSQHIPHYFNPMILAGVGQSYRLFHAMDPSEGYHASLLYMGLRGDLCQRMASAGNITKSTVGAFPPTIDATKVNTCMFEEFSAWCEAFHEHAQQGNVVVRSHCGDALDFCNAVTLKKAQHSTAGQDSAACNQQVDFIPKFQLSSLTIESDTPLEYDSVEAGNLSNSHGLLAILMTCMPLLGMASHSTLSTDLTSQVLCHPKGGRFHIYFDRELRFDVATFCSITGFILVDFHLQYCQQFRNAREAFRCEYLNKDTEAYVSIDWKRSLMNDKLTIRDNDFEKLFHDFYKWIYVTSQHLYHLYYDGFDGNLTQSVRSDNYYEYMRSNPQAFVRLVTLAADNIILKDREEMTVHLITHARLKLGSNSDCFLLDLFCWFYFYKMISAPRFDMHIQSIMKDAGISHRSPGFQYFGGEQAPRVALVTLLISKHDLQSKLEGINSPVIEMAAITLRSYNRFPCYHVAYIRKRLMLASGKPVNSSEQWDFQLKHFALAQGTENDHEYVAYSCYIPVIALAQSSPEDVKVALCFSSTAIHRLKVDKKAYPKDQFGMFHFVKLSDTRHCSWCPVNETHLPVIPFLPRYQYLEDQQGGLADQSVVSPYSVVMSPEGSILLYSFTITLKDPSLLQPGVAPTFVCRGHPLMLRIFIGKLDNSLFLDKMCPPVTDTSNLRLKVDRKKGVLHIVLIRQTSLLKRLFPLYRDGQGLSYWGCKRVMLDSLPKIEDVPVSTSQHKQTFVVAAEDVSKELAFLPLLITMQYTAEETAQRATSEILSSGLSSMKETIHYMACGFIGHELRPRKQIFFLSCNREQGVQFLVYINDIRLELSLGSIVIDAAVCIVTFKNLKAVVENIDELAERDISQTIISEPEVELWKEMLPLACERARNTWKHTSKCEYMQKQAAIPLNLKMGEPALCSCCLGKGFEGTPFYTQHRKSKLFPHFFRAAISPIFQPFFLRSDLQVPGGDYSELVATQLGPQLSSKYQSLLPANTSEGKANDNGGISDDKEVVNANEKESDHLKGKPKLPNLLAHISNVYQKSKQLEENNKNKELKTAGADKGHDNAVVRPELISSLKSSISTSISPNKGGEIVTSGTWSGSGSLPGDHSNAASTGSDNHNLSPLLSCSLCGTSQVQIFRCSRCKSVEYCSLPCQKKDWSRHKLVCKAI